MKQFNENFTTAFDNMENEIDDQSFTGNEIDQYSNRPEASENISFTELLKNENLDQSHVINEENEAEKLENIGDEISFVAKNKDTHNEKRNMIPQNLGKSNYLSNGLLQTVSTTKKSRNEHLINSAGASGLNEIYESLKKICQKYNLNLKKPNFQKLFCGNSKYHLQFIEAKIYQILIHNCPENEKIIRDMVEKFKDEVFIYIIKCPFEFIYKKYIEEQNDDIIPLNENNINIEIKTLTEVVKKKKIEMVIQGLTEEEINEKIIAFEKISKNFLNEIHGNGKFKSRKNAKTPKFAFKILSYIET